MEATAVRTEIEITTSIVAAFAASNALPAADLPGLVGAVHAKVSELLSGEEPVATVEPPKPAVPIAKSITPDFLICLDDGKRFRSLRRHLGKLGMTPEAYRDKWGLPGDYPMVAPAYSSVRSTLAKGIGLGRRGVAA